MSLLQENSLLFDQNNEEDEDLEEQKRRDEELSSLLADGIVAFEHDDNTMNSTPSSAEEELEVSKTRNLKYEDSRASLDNFSIERNYKDADQNEQLKILYEVRVREINKLREEFEKFKQEKSDEFKILKNKLTLSEAEIRHLQVSLTNSESLLVEKNDAITNLKKNVAAQNQEVENLKKLVEDQNLEICTYKSTVNELQLKIADNNPFSLGAKRLKSEELQKAHQDQIIKLETLLQEQTKRVQILEKEKLRLQEDVQKLLANRKETEEENNLTVMALSKKLQSAQQQCKDLFVLGEAIKKESDHFKDRMHQLESKCDGSGDSFQSKKTDKDSVQLEKLKRMLVDKDTELGTLKAKLKFYDSDLSELFEYRQLLNKMYSPDVKTCNNAEHNELIIFMRGQIQSCQQAVEDRNSQIVTLNMLNKELQEKIEEMLQRTRTDIQNISQKYSLPQLETMSNELKNAELTINELRKQKEDLIEKLEKLNQENADLKQAMMKERKKLEEMKKEEFRKIESGLIEENEKMKTQLQKICLKLGLSEAEIFESEVHDVNKYEKIHEQLQLVLTHLETTNPKRINFNIILNLKKQTEAYLNLLLNRKVEMKEIEEQLEQWDNMLSDFLESLRHSDPNSENANTELQELMNARIILEGEKCTLEQELKTRTHELDLAKRELGELKTESGRKFQKLNDQIQNLQTCLKITEENKLELEKQLEITQKQLNEAKLEAIHLHKEANEINEHSVKETLVKELEEIESVLKTDEVSFQAELLKAEIALRDRLQEESLAKIKKIEEQFKNVMNEKSEMYKKGKERWSKQESNYRKEFAAILDKCARKIDELENENGSLRIHLKEVVDEYNIFRSNAILRMNTHENIIANCKKTVEDINKQSSDVLVRYMLEATKIGLRQRKIARNVSRKIVSDQTEINFVKSSYDDKIKKIKAEKSKFEQEMASRK